MKPQVDAAAHLFDIFDRCLVGCVLYTLNVVNDNPVFIAENVAASSKAQRLKSKVIAPFHSVLCSLFPQVESFSSRVPTSLPKKLLQSQRYATKPCNPILDQFELQIMFIYIPSQERSGAIHLMLHCDTVQGVISLSSRDSSEILPKEKSRMFMQVFKWFFDDERYRSCNWLLSEEIAAIPGRL